MKYEKLNHWYKVNVMNLSKMKQGNLMAMITSWEKETESLKITNAIRNMFLMTQRLMLPRIMEQNYSINYVVKNGNSIIPLLPRGVLKCYQN